MPSSRRKSADLITACLQIPLKVGGGDRQADAGVYQKYRQAFLDTTPGATSKELLVREEDVQVVHCFSAAEAQACLGGEVFTHELVGVLSPLLQTDPDVHIYETA